MQEGLWTYKLFVHVPKGSSEEVNSNLQTDRKGVPFEWTEEHQKIFEELKKDHSKSTSSCHAK